MSYAVRHWLFFEVIVKILFQKKTELTTASLFFASPYKKISSQNLDSCICLLFFEINQNFELSTTFCTYILLKGLGTSSTY